MAKLKCIRFKYSSLLTRERRPSSLQDCLEKKRECRRSHKNWIIVVLLLLCVHFTYKYFHISDEYQGSLQATTILIIPADELLTTMKLKQKKIQMPTEDFYNYYKLDPRLRMTVGLSKQRLPKCIDHKLVGAFPVNTTKIELAALENEFPMVQTGGYYRPLNCTSRQKIAIVVAFRGRDINLAIFLSNLHPFLMMQQLEYQIFVIEQSGITYLFNKGRLYNVGFKEVFQLKKFECIVFHDVDLLPMNMEIRYSCPTFPRHMSTFINETEIQKTSLEYKFKSMFGGVVSMNMEMIIRTNGFSNLYFGWGGEDNDMLWRLRAVGYPIVRYNKTIGVYLIMPHIRAPVNEFRHHLLATALDRYKTDGLSDLQYEVIARSKYHLYTHIVADINPRKENDSLWYNNKIKI